MRQPQGLQVIISPRRTVSLVVALALVGFFWVRGSTYLLQRIQQGEGTLLAFASLAIWFFGLPLFAHHWVWRLLGKEVLTLHGAQMDVRKEIFGLGTTRRLAVPGIQAVVFQHRGELEEAGEEGVGGTYRDSRIVVSYQGTAIEFAEGLEKEDAVALVSLIQETLKLQRTS